MYIYQYGKDVLESNTSLVFVKTNFIPRNTDKNASNSFYINLEMQFHMICIKFLLRIRSHSTTTSRLTLSYEEEITSWDKVFNSICPEFDSLQKFCVEGSSLIYKRMICQRLLLMLYLLCDGIRIKFLQNGWNVFVCNYYLRGGIIFSLSFCFPYKKKINMWRQHVQKLLISKISSCSVENALNMNEEIFFHQRFGKIVVFRKKLTRKYLRGKNFRVSVHFYLRNYQYQVLSG